MRRTIDIRFEFGSSVGNMGMEALDLKAAGVSKDRSGPIHKFMNAAYPFDVSRARAKIEMVVVGQNNLSA